MILDDHFTPFSINSNDTATTGSRPQEGSSNNTAQSLAKPTSSIDLSDNTAPLLSASSTSSATLATSHQEQHRQQQQQQQQLSTFSGDGTNRSIPLALPIDRASNILTVESILTTPSTQGSNSPAGSTVMTMAGEATTFFDDMMEDICSSSSSGATIASSTNSTISGTVSAVSTMIPSTSPSSITTTLIPISSSSASGIKALLHQHQQHQERTHVTNTTTTGTGFLTPSPTQSLPELYHDFFDPIRPGTGGGEQRYDDSDQSMSDAEMEMEMDLDMMEDAPSIRARLAEMRRALETVVCRAPLIADIPLNLERTIDTIKLMNHQPNGSAIANGTGQQNRHTLPHQQSQQHHLHQGHSSNNHHTHPNGNGQAPDNNSNNNNLNTTNGNSYSNNNNSTANGNGNNNSSTNNNRSDDQGAGSPPDQQSAPQRRKKASRACFHCQKAHLTCDDSRPCQRCVKRDLASTCADGVRKKAKYLQDAYDSQQVAAEQAAQGGNVNATGMDQQPLLSDQDQQQRQGPGGMEESPLTDANALFNFPMNSDYGFGSEAVNLEYSIISTMLSSPTAELNSMSDLSMVENWQRQGSLEAMANLANSNQLQKALAAQGAAAAAAAASVGAGPGAGASGSNGGLANAGVTNLANGTNANNSNNNSNNNANNSGTNTNTNTNSNNSINNNNNNNSSAPNNATMGLLGPGAPAANNASAPTGFHPPGVTRVSKRKFPSNTPENVYANTKQPFNYTDGFHYLLRYVRERMDKEEMMRICRAMAMFRPSFIALIMNLTPEDLIFMEKCFQRTILEFEKLISFSGTPTVVWRRTGEIALVGKEFSLLTQWGRDQLVGKKTYIYELMDNQSAVEYWEKFSTHAFENTEQTVMTTCILLSPTNRVVPCTFCFTIKRDIFDIPLAIVGNFLPILS